METFYFKDDEGEIQRVSNYKGTVEEFKNQLDKLQYNYLGDDVDNVTGKDYDTFYEDLELNTGAKIEGVIISFNQ